MKYYITYFYNVRFLPPNALPLSTCMWDPKWFHDFKGSSHHFIDKRGVINGLRAEPLCPRTVHSIGAEICGKDCGQPIPCLFMEAYYKYLETLDFSDIISRCRLLAEKAIKPEYGEPIIVFLVSEPPYVKCAERPCLQKWFAEHGIKLTEWERELNDL